MNKLVKRKKEKSIEDELMEITEEMATRKPLDFQSYQKEVMILTSPWPADAQIALKRILLSAGTALEESRNDPQSIVIYLASILRSTAELADSLPMSLERIAHISLTYEMPRMVQLGAENTEEIRKIE